MLGGKKRTKDLGVKKKLVAVEGKRRLEAVTMTNTENEREKMRLSNGYENPPLRNENKNTF